MNPDDIVGKPSERELWLAPDWSNYKPVTAPQPSGWTRVTVRDTMYADGRIVTEVLDAQHNPIKSQILDQQTDKDQQARFTKDDASRNPPGGVTTKRVMAADGKYHIYGWNPDTKQYDDDQGVVEGAASNAQKPNVVQVEGTPTGQKNPDGTEIYDNSRPVMASHWPDGRVTYEPLTPAERQQWEKDKNGGKTDAELAAATEEASSQTQVPGRPEWVAITRKKGNDTKTTYRGPDGKEVESLPEETKTGSKQFVHTDGKTYFEVTETKGNVTSVYVTDSAGNRVTLPGRESKTVTQKTAPNGTPYYEVSVEKDGNKETYTSSDAAGITRITPPTSPMAGVKGVPSFTPDLTKPGAGLLDRQKQLDELYQAGKLTWEQRQAILAEDVKAAQTVTGEFNTAATLLREKYQSDVSQRGQDMTQANSRASLANSHFQNAVSTIEKFAPYLGATAGDAGKLFMGMMASQLATATMYGGMKDSPQVQMDPRLQAYADRKLNDALAPQMPGAVPPGPGEASAPNALGLGAVGAVPAPVGAVPPPPGAAVSAPAISAAPVPPAVSSAPAVGTKKMIRVSMPDGRVIYYDAALRPELVGHPGGQLVDAPADRPDGYLEAPGAAPSVAPLQSPAGNVPPGMMSPNPPDIGAPIPPVNPLPGQSGNNPSAPVGMANPAMEQLFGKTLPPPPTSWREDAQNRLFALQMPDPQASSVGAGLFGGSLPPWMQAPGGMDYSLPMPQGGGATDAIDAEARRQLAVAGIRV